MTELKPCPFCGREAEIIAETKRNIGFTIWCECKSEVAKQNLQKNVRYKMTRSETTKFLSRLLEKSCFSGPGKYWAREVSLDYGYAAGKPRRVDYMQFIPENQCAISAIEKGIFACYEIKSCKEDIYSGNGLNFIGEKNYLVTTMECYKEILPDLKNGKFAQHIRENFPECYAEIGNMGVMVAVPYQREVAEEFENSTPLDGDVEKWKLSVAIKCNHNGSRKRSMTELLFCMVRSGR